MDNDLIVVDDLHPLFDFLRHILHGIRLPDPHQRAPEASIGLL